MWTELLDWPDSICRATASAWLIGMANPSVALYWNELPVDAAVFIPIT